MFGSSITIGEIAGIKIRLHSIFIWFVVFVILIDTMYNGLYGFILSSLTMFIIFGSVVLHELGHSLTAKKYGIDVRDIVLLPIGGVAELENIPENPKIEFKIAIAGPLVNLMIIAVALPVLYILPPRSLIFYLTLYLIEINFLMFAFNLLPAFPLDGGRIFRSYLARKYGFLEATEKAAKIGKTLSIILGVLAVFQMFGIIDLWRGLNIFTIIIAIFLYQAAEAELNMVRMRHFFNSSPMYQDYANSFSSFFNEFEKNPNITVILKGDDLRRFLRLIEELERRHRF